MIKTQSQLVKFNFFNDFSSSDYEEVAVEVVESFNVE
jgi:hypothetical protein